MKVRFGIMGCGFIANDFAAACKGVSGAQLYACSSRSLGKAQAFAQKHDIPLHFGSYEELANDPTVDVIYIATPHSHHYQNALLALNNGKHITPTSVLRL